MLGKGNFLLSKLVCNRQSNQPRLGIIVNQFDKLQSDLTKQCRQIKMDKLENN
jgi:hypothetical protein